MGFTNLHLLRAEDARQRQGLPRPADLAAAAAAGLPAEGGAPPLQQSLWWNGTVLIHFAVQRLSSAEGTASPV